eukprot:Gb_21204 [translate_table: standard]
MKTAFKQSRKTFWSFSSSHTEEKTNRYARNKAYSSKRGAFQREEGHGDGGSNSRVERDNNTQSGQQRGREFPMRGRGFSARERGFATRGRGGRGACFRCGQFGHRIAECPQLQEDGQRRTGTNAVAAPREEEPIEEAVWMDEGEVMKLGVSLEDLKEWF